MKTGRAFQPSPFRRDSCSILRCLTLRIGRVASNGLTSSPGNPSLSFLPLDRRKEKAMPPLRDRLVRLRGTLRAKDLDARLDEEIQFHLDMHAQRGVHRGATADHARRDAAVAFGGRDGWREAARDEMRERTVEAT